MSDSVLLPGPDDEAPPRDRSVVQDGHPGAGHEVAAAQGARLGTVRSGCLIEVAVDDRADVDELRRAAEVGDDGLRVRARRRRRRPVRHQHAQERLRADRLGDEVRHERRVDAARQPQHEPVEAGLAQLALDEAGDDPSRDVGVDRELGRQVEDGRRVRRRVGRGLGHGWPPGSVESSARPARSRTIRSSSRSWSSGRSSRRSGRPIRSRRMSAGAMSTQNRPSS